MCLNAIDSVSSRYVAFCNSIDSVYNLGIMSELICFLVSNVLFDVFARLALFTPSSIFSNFAYSSFGKMLAPAILTCFLNRQFPVSFSLILILFEQFLNNKICRLQRDSNAYHESRCKHVDHHHHHGPWTKRGTSEVLMFLLWFTCNQCDQIKIAKCL